jgi:hypothetical protein
MPELELSYLTERAARGELYKLERRWLSQRGHPDHVALAAAMEVSIVTNGGFPPGSFYVRPQLLQFSADQWENVLKNLELGGTGNASLAARYIEYQRAYQLREIIIVYTVVPTQRANLILFDSINFPGRSRC